MTDQLVTLPHSLALRVLTERVTDGITIQDAQGHVVYANDAAAHRAGYADAEDMLRNPLEWRKRLDFLDSSGMPIDVNDFPGRRLLLGERPEPLLVKSVDRTDGSMRWVSIHAEPFRGPDGEVQYVVDTIQDVTERVLAEEQARRWAENQRFLVQSARELGASLDLPRTLRRVAALMVPHLADWCVVDLLESDGSLQAAVIAHADPARTRRAEDLRRRFPPDPRAAGGPWAAIREGKTLKHEVTDEILDNANLDPAYREGLRLLEVHSVVVVPLKARGQNLGAITLVWQEHGRAESPVDVAMAEELGFQAALAIDNARLFAERDRVSRALQTALLPPSLPEVAGFELAARYWPAGADMEVGGDFYDAFDRPDGSLGLVVGDVCGKGAEAAAVMGVARQTVRAAGVREARPSSILQVLNEALLRDQTDLFCTACDIRIRPQGEIASITVCLAGHPPPFVLRSSGDVERAGTPGSLVGVLEHPSLTDTPGELRLGDSLVLYTDGLVERRGQSLEPELAALLSARAGDSASEIVSAVAEWRKAGSSSHEADDAVVLVAKFVTPSTLPDSRTG